MRLERLIVALSVIVSGCAREAPPAVTSTESAPRTVDVVRVVEQRLNVTLSLPAELAPYESVAIYPRVSGFLKSASVDRGSRVRAGALLAVLDAPEVLSQRAEAQSKLQAAEAQLNAVRAKAEGSASTSERLKAASATPGVVAGNDVVVAQKMAEADAGQVASARESAEAARQALAAVRDMENYLQVTAPFDGVITERNVHPGALVGPSSNGGGAPMFRLVQDQRLRLVVPVPEAYIAGVTTGMTIPFSVAAYPAESFSGTVARIAHSVDVGTRTMAVELDVQNGDGRLTPGAFCQVKWPVGREHLSLLVPSTSVASTTGRTFVVRVQNGHTEWVDVTTGLSSGQLVEVFGPLRAGDAIVAHGTDEIASGAAVQSKQAAR